MSDDLIQRALKDPIFKRRKKNSGVDIPDSDDKRFSIHPLRQGSEKITDQYGRTTAGGKRIRAAPGKSKQQADEERLEYLQKLSRGEISPAASSSDDSDSDSESISSGQKSVEDEDEGDESSNDENEEQIASNFPIRYNYGAESSRRLALQNCDWQNVSALDIMMILRSFCRVGNNSSSSLDLAIQCVTVYESDFGREMMSKEAREGPDRSIFSDSSEVHRQQESRSDSGDHVESAVVRKVGRKEVKNEEDKFDERALKQYELKKLRYYFAIIECGEAAVAEHLYAELDQVQLFEDAPMVCELSFVPDDTDFTTRRIRDSCTNADATLSVASYQPPKDFHQKNGLYHTRVECTWDADEGESRRGKLLTNISQWRTLNHSELQQYVASSDSSVHKESELDDSENDSDTGEKKKKLLNIRESLLGDDGLNGSDDFFLDAGSDDPKDSSMKRVSNYQVTSSNLSSISDQEVGTGTMRTITYLPDVTVKEIRKRRNAKCASSEETPYQADLRKFAERRREKNKKQLVQAGVELSGECDQEHSSVQPASQLYKRGRKEISAKQRKKTTFEDKPNQVNLHDARFDAVFSGTDPKFGIDSTAREFRETEGMRAILSRQQQVREESSRSLSSTGYWAGRQPSEIESNDNSLKHLASKLRSKY